MESFKCGNCGREVDAVAVGTKNRNHCPWCLWSKHLDEKIPGDRASFCKGMMMPVAVTFKNEGDKAGELMIVHKCTVCGQVEKNRVAGDDEVEVTIEVYKKGVNLTAEEKSDLQDRGIKLARVSDEREVITQLLGKPEAMKRLGTN